MEQKISLSDLVNYLHDVGNKIGSFISVCLYGATGSGKTARALELSEKLQLPLAAGQPILLHSRDPDMLLGLPDTGDRKVVNWKLPDWAQDAIANPRLIFIDELDKAVGKRGIDVILTLLASHTVQGYKLHEKSRILCASQLLDATWVLADQSGDALVARLCWLPTSYDWTFLENKYDLPGNCLGFLPVEELSPPIRTIPCPRQIDTALELMYRLREKDPWKEIVMGFLSDEIAEQMWEATKKTLLSPKALIEALMEKPEDVWKLKPLQIANLIDAAVRHGDTELQCAIFDRMILGRDVTVDDRQQLLQRMYNTWQAIADAGEEAYPAKNETNSYFVDQVGERIEKIYDLVQGKKYRDPDYAAFKDFTVSDDDVVKEVEDGGKAAESATKTKSTTKTRKKVKKQDEKK